MAYPTKDDCKRYPGADGTPANDTDPIIGAIDTGAEMDEETANLYFDGCPTPESGPDADPVYAGGYLRLECASPGSLVSARVCNRAGAKVNTDAGLPSVQSTQASDVGQVRCVAMVAAAWAPQDITATGTTRAYASSAVDAGTARRWEYLGATPPKGNIYCYVGSQLCAIIYGKLDLGDARGLRQASTEHRLALADAINQTVEAADRTEEPADISAFSQAVLWPGADESIPVPGGVLEGPTDYIGFVVEYVGYSGITPPDAGELFHDVMLVGIPRNS